MYPFQHNEFKKLEQQQQELFWSLRPQKIRWHSAVSNTYLGYVTAPTESNNKERQRQKYYTISKENPPLQSPAGNLLPGLAQAQVQAHAHLHVETELDKAAEKLKTQKANPTVRFDFFFEFKLIIDDHF